MKKWILFFLILFLIPQNIFAFHTSAECAILMDMNSHRIFYSTNMNKQKSVASISKIMTAVLAIESGKLEDTVEIGEEIKKAYGSAVYLQEGEHISLKDLVYGLMLRSGNDAALAIAKYVGGSVSDFVSLMNEKANEIGMKNTLFHNPSGLDEEDKGNLSTAYDMALLTSYAMKSDVYKEIVVTKTHRVKTDKNQYLWHNKNKMLSIYPYTIGGKTGFTEIAKRTLVSTASRDHLNLVVVTLNDGNDWTDHKALYIDAFDSYRNYQILKKGVVDIEDETYYLNHEFYIKNDFSYPLLETEKDSISLKFELEKKKNYKSDDEVGKLRVFIGEKEVYQDSLYIRELKRKKISIWERIVHWFKHLW